MQVSHLKLINAIRNQWISEHYLTVLIWKVVTTGVSMVTNRCLQQGSIGNKPALFTTTYCWLIYGPLLQGSIYWSQTVGYNEGPFVTNRCLHFTAGVPWPQTVVYSRGIHWSQIACVVRDQNEAPVSQQIVDCRFDFLAVIFPSTFCGYGCYSNSSHNGIARVKLS